MDLRDLLGRPERWASVLGLATLAGVEFGLIGPFGSYASNIFTRTAYWTGLFWIGSMLLWPSVVAAILLGPRRGFPPLFSGAAAVLIACIPLAAFGAAGTQLFWPVRAAAFRALEWYGMTVIVAGPAVAALMWVQLGKANMLLARFGLAPAGGFAADMDGSGVPVRAPSVPPLPDHLLGRALCLQMEDHHVRIHGHGRSFLHLAVMRDVVAMMDEARGLQVHRSWWVARDAVRGWRTEGRSVTLILINGLRVPVARQRVALLRARGWLDGEGE